MPGRTRTTKGLAGRIQWAYYKSVFPIPRWRTLLSRGFLAVGILWVAWYALARNSAIYSSGPLTKAHASFGKDCTSCHNQNLGLAKTITDSKCQSCHDGPMHSDRQIVTPPCASCHLEHRGQETLVASSNSACVDCHSGLRVKSGTPAIAASIRSFTDGHPEFSAAKPDAQDPGHLRFNHKTHVKDLSIACGDCHKLVGSDAAAGASGPRPRRAYYSQVNYAASCASCHPLDFDRRIPDAVPHEVQPDVVHAFIEGAFQDYIAAHPEELKPKPNAERIPRETMERVPASAKEWVALRVAESEHLLWTKTCVECHVLTPGKSAGALPAVTPPGLPARWLKQGNFNHSAHTSSDCTVCHAAALKSEKSSDVMIPGIAVCRQCHNASWSHKGFDAGANCLECHQYHDWSKEKDVQRKMAGL